MSDEKKSSKNKEPETAPEIANCIGIVTKPDGTYEVKVFVLEDSRVVKMEIIPCQNKAYALEKFKIEAGKKVISKIVSM